MKLVWAAEAWADYRHWCRKDVRMCDRVNALIEDGCCDFASPAKAENVTLSLPWLTIMARLDPPI